MRYTRILSWSFLYPPPAMSEIEIYDLKTGQGERNDLASSHPELVGKMLDFMVEILHSRHRKEAF